MDDYACGQPLLHTGIWWTYGGEPLLALRPEPTHVGSLTSPVLKNADFDRFQELVHAHRALRPDGEMCESHRGCAYYDVVATYTGRFFAGKMNPGAP